MKNAVIFIISIFLSIYVHSMETALHPRTELTRRLVGHNQLPQQALRAIYNGIILGINEKLIIKIDDGLKEKVWTHVSAQRIENLRELFLDNVEDMILGNFSDDEINSMLEEHKKNNIISNHIANGGITVAMAFNKERIQNILIANVENMKTALIEEILQHIQ